MGVRKVAIMGLATALALPGLTAGAETSVQDRLDALEKKVEAQGRGVAAALGIDIHGLVAIDYMYNMNNPKAPGDYSDNSGRVFDTDSNSFTVNQANLRFSRERENEDFGFVTSLDFGKTADVVREATWWSKDEKGSSNSFELREAFVTYKAPIGDGVTLKAGKMVTVHGAEVIKDYNRVNPTISNSFLFGYAIPFTHTGIMASFPAGDFLAVDLGLVNGWDDVVDNNDGKSFHGGLKILPNDTYFNLYLSGTVGPEQPDNGKSKRTLLNAVATLNASEELTFILDGVYGTENNVPNGPAFGADHLFDDGTRYASWCGLAGYVIYKVDNRLSLMLRAEGFDDTGGSRTLVRTGNHGPGVTVWEITPGVSYQLTDGLVARAEYRHDEADRPIFWTDNHGKEYPLQNGQDTIAAELIYAF